VLAYVLADGRELWSDIVQAPAVANPAVYDYKGREYVAFVAGGSKIVKDQGRRPGRRLRPAAVTRWLASARFKHLTRVGDLAAASARAVRFA
jgi:hypothetical protein